MTTKDPDPIRPVPARQVSGAVLAALVLVAAACSGIRSDAESVMPDRLAKATTFAWRAPAADDDAVFTADPTFARAVEGAVEAELTRRGLRRADATHADLLVIRRANVRVVSERSDPYFTQAQVRQFEEGELSVELVDRATQSTVWRGAGRSRLREVARGGGVLQTTLVPSNQARNWRAAEKVRAMFEDFPERGK